MVGEQKGGSGSMEELMECARRRALLDDWELDGDVVRLSVGTYAIELRREAAHRFVRSLLKKFDVAAGIAGR